VIGHPRISEIIYRYLTDVGFLRLIIVLYFSVTELQYYLIDYLVSGKILTISRLPACG